MPAKTRSGTRPLAQAICAAILCFVIAGPASALGELDWVEVQMVLDDAGRAEVTYQARWRTSEPMRGFYFKGTAGTPSFTGGSAELPDGRSVPLSIGRDGDRWDIVLDGGIRWGPGEAT